MKIQKHYIKDYDKRSPCIPKFIVLHCTGGASWRGADNWAHNPGNVVKLSGHCLVKPDGDIIQHVPEEYQAYHAGKGSYPGAKKDCMNLFSYGIEIVNSSNSIKETGFKYMDLYGNPVNRIMRLNGENYEAYTKQQIESVITECRRLMDKYNIPVKNIIRHSDWNPERKVNCPGAHFPMKEIKDRLRG